ncbi:MAG: carboxypeptidase regulatory-like domain-containing protein, partial [Bdellovibrionales bacterium]|nr:carboxypeptidase regulatory-like domain-containing protein [Bdellovibrionales bacterium]
MRLIIVLMFVVSVAAILLCVHGSDDAVLSPPTEEAEASQDVAVPRRASMLSASVPPPVTPSVAASPASDLRTGVVSISVVDEQNQPVAGVEISLTAFSGGDLRLGGHDALRTVSMESDAAGCSSTELPWGVRYQTRVTRLPPGFVRAPGDRDIDFIMSRVTPVRELTVHVVLGTTISGRVLGPMGQPVTGALVRLQPVDGMPGKNVDVTTDRGGRYQAAVHPGQFRVFVFPQTAGDEWKDYPQPLPVEVEAYKGSDQSL